MMVCLVLLLSYYVPWLLAILSVPLHHEQEHKSKNRVGVVRNGHPVAFLHTGILAL